MNQGTYVPSGDTEIDRAAQEIVRFVCDEALMLDEGRYDEWLALWTDVATYWVPVDPLASPTQHISIIHDDRERLGQRVRRLQSRYNWTVRPPIRVCRIVSNIRIEQRRADRTVATSNFVLGAYRTTGDDGEGSGQSSYFGSLRHELLHTDGGLRIASKRVDLINSQGPLEKISFLL